jgi:hypothetical protein
MRRSKWGLAGIIARSDWAVGELLSLYYQLYPYVILGEEAYDLVMTSRSNVLETIKTITAPDRLAIYETTNPSHTPNVYPDKTINVE